MNFLKLIMIALLSLSSTAFADLCNFENMCPGEDASQTWFREDPTTDLQNFKVSIELSGIEAKICHTRENSFVAYSINGCTEMRVFAPLEDAPVNDTPNVGSRNFEIGNIVNFRTESECEDMLGTLSILSNSQVQITGSCEGGYHHGTSLYSYNLNSRIRVANDSGFADTDTVKLSLFHGSYRNRALEACNDKLAVLSQMSTDAVQIFGSCRSDIQMPRVISFLDAEVVFN